MSTGKLYLVATPIGNLEDITLRALRILGEVDVIAAEDTRQTIKLLNHYEIKNKLIAYQKFNEEKAMVPLIQRLKKGENIALVSDAGMPLISDPGYRLSSKCIEEHIPIEVIPGANAGLCALLLSGLSTESFLFLGFLPKQTKGFKEGIQRVVSCCDTVILYESPHRLLKTLKALEAGIGERRISISREITKRYEETLRGSVAELLAYFTEKAPRGEFVIVVEGGTAGEKTDPLAGKTIEEQRDYYCAQGLTEKEAMRRIAQNTGRPRREIYKQLKC
ncbi:MAG: 16S rRNA (cytidine(1402)-2'-O)-methyltransferase [Eubacteriaceae bacterium]|jgi:16S rRNA (cytidine1402-2'-O)-methyltransferase|nr:16S rRNA (cytidine(1402)-2'-O)-methyltransferase [Eubacteriaceae bacterium]